MNVAICDDELAGIVELLGFIAQLCDEEDELISIALARFTGIDIYRAAELRLEVTHWADFLARALGFADDRLDAVVRR